MEDSEVLLIGDEEVSEEDGTPEALVNEAPQIEKHVIKFGLPRRDPYNRPVYQGRCGICGRCYKNHRSVYKHIATAHRPQIDPGVTTRNRVITDFFRRNPEEAAQAAARVRADDGIHVPIEERPEEGNLNPPRRALCDFLTQCGVSINSVKKSTFRALLDELGADDRLPVSPIVVRTDLIERGNEIWNQTLDRLAECGECTLITDGATVDGRHFYPVIAFTKQRLYFLTILEVKRADHLTLATELARIVIELRDRKGVKVRAVITDNARNLVRALDDEQPAETMQQLADTQAIHIRCGIHSAQLGLTDFRKQSPEFKGFVQAMKGLFEWMRPKAILDEFRNRGGTGKMPVISKIKWTTYYQAADFLFRNHDIICGLIADTPDRDRPKITWVSEYYQIAAAMYPIAQFVVSVEGDLVCLPEYWEATNAFIARSDELGAQGNVYAKRLGELVHQRIMTTGDGQLAELAYSFTKVGWDSLQAGPALKALRDAQAGRITLTPEQQERCFATMAMTSRLSAKLISLAPYVGIEDGFEELIGAYETYLEKVSYAPPQGDLDSFWARISGHGRPFFQLGMLARLLLGLPASEAACERLISVFETLFPLVRMASKSDLIKAQMRIRAEQIFGAIGH
jgi:hypothetical protein